MLILLLAAGACVCLCAILAVLFLTSRKPSTAPGATSAATAASPGGVPQRVFAPFWYGGDESVRWQDCPAKMLVLAFVLADSSGAPSWNGQQPIASKSGLVSRMRQAGKEVIVSFGGQSGKELGQVIRDVDKLAAAYVSVIDTLGLKWIDLDIEGGSTSDTEAVVRRHRALVKVQRDRPSVTVSYTLPVGTGGLLASEVKFLRLAKEAGVRVDVVNIMTMDYGESFTGDMGAYAIQAAKGLRDQLVSVGLRDTKVGICPMIGNNDVRGETFTVANARAVREFAQKTDWVRWLTFWSINRDNARAGGLDTSSQIRQKDWEFSAEFAKFV